MKEKIKKYVNDWIKERGIINFTGDVIKIVVCAYLFYYFMTTLSSVI